MDGSEEAICDLPRERGAYSTELIAVNVRRGRDAKGVGPWGQVVRTVSQLRNGHKIIPEYPGSVNFMKKGTP